jgi:hypothetical protein
MRKSGFSILQDGGNSGAICHSTSDWSTQEGLIANLGLPAARNEKFEKARNGVLTLITLSSSLSKAQPIPSPFMTPFAPATGNDGRGRHPLAVKPGRTCG